MNWKRFLTGNENDETGLDASPSVCATAYGFGGRHYSSAAHARRSWSLATAFSTRQGDDLDGGGTLSLEWAYLFFRRPGL